MGIVDNIAKRFAQAEENSRVFSEDEKDAAGREAERIVARDLRPRLSGTGWELVQNIRVPDPSMRRQRELDFVITAPDRVVVLELKRWSGKVFMRDGDVIQERRSGEVVNHGDLFGDLADRVELLRHRHLAAKGDQVRIQGLLVFFDEHGKLSLSSEIAGRPDVVDYARMMESMPQRGALSLGLAQPSFLSTVLNGILAMLGHSFDAPKTSGPHGPCPSPAIEGFRRALAEFGTWDIVELHGGRTYYGDVLGETGAEHPAIKGALFNRAATSRVEIDCERGVFGALFGTHDDGATAKAIGRNGFVGDWRLPADMPIVMRAAGQRTSESFPAGSVVAVEFGYERKAKTRLLFADLALGMLLTGKVKRLTKHGAFVDIGLEKADGEHCDVLARLGGPGRKGLTLEQAEAWSGMKPGARMFVRVKMLDAAGHRADIEIVHLGIARAA
jgi:hypothetical protein